MAYSQKKNNERKFDPRITSRYGHEQVSSSNTIAGKLIGYSKTTTGSSSKHVGTCTCHSISWHKQQPVDHKLSALVTGCRRESDMQVDTCSMHSCSGNGVAFYLMGRILMILWKSWPWDIMDINPTWLLVHQNSGLLQPSLWYSAICFLYWAISCTVHNARSKWFVFRLIVLCLVSCTLARRMIRHLLLILVEQWCWHSHNYHLLSLLCAFGYE